jgi:hypothetical protein
MVQKRIKIAHNFSSLHPAELPFIIRLVIHEVHILNNLFLTNNSNMNIMPYGNTFFKFEDAVCVTLIGNLDNIQLQYQLHTVFARYFVPANAVDS